MALADCARCSGKWCNPDVPVDETPDLCPRRLAPGPLAEADRIRSEDPAVKRLDEVAASVETDGYRIWPRVQELIEFSNRLNMRRIGIGFCVGLRKETQSLVEILESHGFEVATVACTVNRGCNPVGQAQVLNAMGVDLYVVMGLCLGHDALFTQFAEGPVTTLVVKDRVTCHSPVGPLLSRYWLKTLVKVSLPRNNHTLHDPRAGAPAE